MYWIIVVEFVVFPRLCHHRTRLVILLVLVTVPAGGGDVVVLVSVGLLALVYMFLDRQRGDLVNFLINEYSFQIPGLGPDLVDPVDVLLALVDVLFGRDQRPDLGRDGGSLGLQAGVRPDQSGEVGLRNNGEDSLAGRLLHHLQVWG